jgi:hypothetical protein
MKIAKAAALMVVSSVFAKHHETVESTNESTLSMSLKQTVGEGKMTYMANRSLSKRSSEKSTGIWSSFMGPLFGASNTRTAFDRRVDAYVKEQKMLTKKQLRKDNSKRLRATTIDHDLVYAVVLPMFLGEIRMGSTQTILDVVYDTGSDWLVIPDIECEECDGETHDNSDSGESTDDNLTERNYGSASLIGKTHRDKVCLSSSTSGCVSDFEYFSFLN